MEMPETYPKFLDSTKDIKYLAWDQAELLHASVTQEYNRTEKCLPARHWWWQDKQLANKTLQHVSNFNSQAFPFPKYFSAERTSSSCSSE